MQNESVLLHVLIERIGEFSSNVVVEFGGNKRVITRVIANHHEAIEKVIKMLQEYELARELGELDAIAHRVVQGEEEFTKAIMIDNGVIAKIKEFIPLAPLHNPANLEGITVCRKKAPFVKQIAVFDTAFHATLPKEAYLYAIAHKFYEEHKIRRYGFHGTSHLFVAKEASKLLGKKLEECNLITLHLGNGSSACAIEQGKSVDTSMGFTPLEGLVMGSRSGDIDPVVIIYMQRTLGMSVDEVDRALNKESGLLGLCGENDVRAILERDDEEAKEAIAIMTRRIKKYIGAYMALLGRVDGIVFTGGIGEHAPKIREAVLNNMACEIKLDSEQNAKNATTISHAKSSVKIFVIPTNEELEIARQSAALLKK